MSSDSAIIIGEDWISEHYFGAEAKPGSTAQKGQSFAQRVRGRRKEWDDTADSIATVRSRFTADRTGLETHLAELTERWSSQRSPSTELRTGASGASVETTVTGDDLGDHYRQVREILGYCTGEYVLSRRGPLLAVTGRGEGGAAPLVIIEAAPVDALEDLLTKDADTLLTPYPVDDHPDADSPAGEARASGDHNGGTGNGGRRHGGRRDRDSGEVITSVPRLLSARFLAEDAPRFALVQAGRWYLIAERDRWAEGRYLAVDLQLVCERNQTARGGEIDRALTCLAAESLAPDADGAIWWTDVLAESIKHTVGVSADLREGVRLSIEIIANEVVRRRIAQGLAPLPQAQANPLAKQALRFLYRILFLLYAEASPELAVLPVGAAEYEQGYGLDRLRELTITELQTRQARQGTHLYDSLALLFRLVDQGHEPRRSSPERWSSQWSPSTELRTGASGATVETTGFDKLNQREEPSQAGLEFHSLRADLFKPEATALIDEVGLGNEAVQRVLRRLLLSKESRGKDRGFISYAELGINQLGAVYEGLMSYTGFFAETDLYEVARHGNPEKGSWVVPVDRADDISTDDFVMTEDETTGERTPVLHERGTFVYRLAGRERQQSASYYTPEVLTRFTVSQALAELLDQDGTTTPARDILDLTICEPALGSGAFAIEAVRQLAEQYLRRRQNELGERIDPEDYPRELQRVKASIALHQVYGVDLNATAVELAEISLWLDTMVAGLEAPWFGLHLKRGNSLIGARRAGYARAQINDKSWLTATPQPWSSPSRWSSQRSVGRGLSSGALRRSSGQALAERVETPSPNSERRDRIHHFLLPATGWGSAVESKDARQLAPDAAAALKQWRKRIRSKPTKKQLDALTELAHRVEVLWELARLRLEVAESEARRAIPLWRHDEPEHTPVVQREQIEATLGDPDGAYQRLRRVMDAWCALWFWPLTDTRGIAPPSLEQWIAALQAILGREPDFRKPSSAVQDTFGAASTWAELDQAESLDRDFAQCQSVDRVLAEHPWFSVCESEAQQQGFFHWELDFASVFARGGFDLQVGNPPWVRPDVDIDALLAEGDPWWQLTDHASEQTRSARRELTLALPGIKDLVVDGCSDVVGIREFVSHTANFPLLDGLRPDLYRCFMEQTWAHMSTTGVVTLVHPETHFTDEKAGLLREQAYTRLRRHWQFINELRLYEIHNLVTYGVHVYWHLTDRVHFLTASSLYHPDTVDRSLVHNGEGPEPGLKDPDGNWDQRPYASRIQTVTDATLHTWHQILEDDDVPVRRSRMVYTVNRAAADVLSILADQPRIGDLGLQFSAGWNEKTDRQKGRFESRWGVPFSWRDVILQGPHLHVATPMYKSPNKTMKSNKDWSFTDFEALAPDAIPATSYKPIGSRAKYDADYTHWDGHSARDYYRVAWRKMAANTGERTLIPAIVPPGTAHIDGVLAAGIPTGLGSVVLTAGFMSSMTLDFGVRAAPKANIRYATVDRLPLIIGHQLASELVLRTLRLTCLTDAYADLWAEVWDDAFQTDAWAIPATRMSRQDLADVDPDWTPTSPLRVAEDRRQALVELDALVALMLGVSADQLCTIYRTQFAVLYGYDHHTYYYDANGRLVPNDVLTAWRKKGDDLDVEERTATNQAGNTYTYELPFRLLDREEDIRAAYTEFERRLGFDKLNQRGGGA